MYLSLPTHHGWLIEVHAALVSVLATEVTQASRTTTASLDVRAQMEKTKQNKTKIIFFA